MEHFWSSIDGYFTFPDFYKRIAAEASTQKIWHGIEIGVYTGQSAAFLGVELANHPAARLDLVDLELTNHRARENLAPLAKTMVALNFLEMSSLAAANMYTEGTFDFVFIDANHAYEAIAADIDAWLPKVRKGGIIAGHDYCQWRDFGVIQAVTERFERVEVWRGNKGMGDAQMRDHFWPCWCVRV